MLACTCSLELGYRQFCNHSDHTENRPKRFKVCHRMNDSKWIIVFHSFRFPIHMELFVFFLVVAEDNGISMKLWEFRSSLIVIIERIFVYNFFLHMSNRMNVGIRYVICERWTTWNINHSNNARIQFFKWLKMRIASVIHLFEF